MPDPNSAMIIRDVCDADMQDIHALYVDEVLTGVSSWEEIPPDIDEMILRRDTIIGAGFPYRVAEQNGRFMGYSYASSYRPRAGYRYTVENSIYVASDARGLGVGRLLMEDLVRLCEGKGYRQMIAVIGDSENLPSIQFHTQLGFEQAGILKSIGYKFGRWMDSVIMQKQLGGGDHSAPG